MVSWRTVLSPARLWAHIGRTRQVMQVVAVEQFGIKGGENGGEPSQSRREAISQHLRSAVCTYPPHYRIMIRPVSFWDIRGCQQTPGFITHGAISEGRCTVLLCRNAGGTGLQFVHKSRLRLGGWDPSRDRPLRQLWAGSSQPMTEAGQDQARSQWVQPIGPMGPCMVPSPRIHATIKPSTL